MSFWGELRRRNVVKVGIAYLAVGWLVAQVIGLALPTFNAPPWVTQTLMLLLVIGFPLILIVAWAFEITPDGVKLTANVPEAESITPQTGRRLNYLVSVVLALAVVFLVIDNYVLPSDEIESTEASTNSSLRVDDRPAESTQMLAVLPFESFSSDPEEQAFADGLTEELLNTLAQIDQLRVTARTSSFAFKNSTRTIREIADVLGVDHVLEGSVRRSGETLRITAQLILAEDESHLLSEAFDRDIAEIFVIQEEIAGHVAEALEITLGVGELGTRPGMTRDWSAYENYLLGLSYRQRISPVDTERTVRTAATYYQEAIRIDPTFALAWLELNFVYTQAMAWATDAPLNEWAANASRALAQATALMPTSPAVLSAAAWAALSRGDWVEAAEIYGGLIDSAGRTRDAVLSRDYGIFLMLVGRPGEAIQELERAQLIDPLHPQSSFQLGLAYLFAGEDTSTSLVALDRAIDLAGGDVFYGTGVSAALASLDVELIEERVTMQQTFAPQSESINLLMSEVLADPTAARSRLVTLFDRPSNATVHFTTIALWAGYLGDAQLALEALEQVPDDQVWALAYQIWHPVLSDARKLLGFKEVVRDMGLVDYWREFGWSKFCRPSDDGLDFECD